MNNKSFLILLFSLIIIVSCNRNSYKSGKNISQATGWKINSADGGFKLNSKYKGQINAPGMIFVQGGTFVKGNTKDININTEHPEFSEYKWVKKDFLIPNIVPFKKEVYLKVIKDFKKYL